jgi:hypothetical protein
MAVGLRRPISHPQGSFLPNPGHQHIASRRRRRAPRGWSRRNFVPPPWPPEFDTAIPLGWVSEANIFLAAAVDWHQAARAGSDSHRLSRPPLRTRHAQKERNVQTHFSRTFSRNLLTYGDGEFFRILPWAALRPWYNCGGRWSRRLKRLVSHCIIKELPRKNDDFTSLTRLGHPNARVPPIGRPPATPHRSALTRARP